MKKHYQDMLEKLQVAGVPPVDAANLAAARIFGEAPATYGTGVSELVKATSAWDSTQELTDTVLAQVASRQAGDGDGEAAVKGYEIDSWWSFCHRFLIPGSVTDRPD